MVKILNEVGVDGKSNMGVIELVAKYRFKMIKMKNFCCWVIKKMPHQMLEPFSITWTIIPGMTSKVSFIGHLAITDSTGM